MKKTTYILLSSVALLSAGCERHSSIIPDVEQGPAIEIGVTSEFLAETKATMINQDNHQSYSFMAFGNVSGDIWGPQNVFGANGTEVSFTEDKVWDYSPKQYWQVGSYLFAGVMPSSLAGTQSSLNGNTLTLNFGNSGFNLKDSQTDLLVTFDVVEVNSLSSTSPVEFAFTHQLSLIEIKAASEEERTDIRIDKVEVYGMSPSTTGDMAFTYNDGTVSSEYDLTYPGDNVYRSFTGAWMFEGESTESTTIISDLLVFPQECSFSIKVTYTDCYGDSEINYTKTGTLQANWAAGMKYTYTFGISLEDITFDEPTVTSWPTTDIPIDDSPEM